MSDAPYDELILARMGEIALKGLNRSKFEQQLFRNMRRRLQAIGSYKIEQRDSRIYIESREGKPNTEEAIQALRDVFGTVSLSPVRRFGADLKSLEQQALLLASDCYADGKARSFKVECRRIQKSFPLSSYEVCCHLGDLISEAFPGLARVDVQHPDQIFYVEIREKIYIYTDIIPARKGLPVGMGGKGMLLLSGGIDSPVAGYMMASRGMQLEACYFHTFPYTSEEARQKVIDLARILSRYAGRIKLHIVDFTELQLQLNDHCPEDMLTVVMRRLMLMIAENLARDGGMKALITGESLGQVASQTLEAILCTNSAVSLPVFRPLIGMDKDQTTEIARDIGSFETSILQYEDCCTVFVAKHPKTHPSLSDCEWAEKDLDLSAMALLGAQRTESILIDLHQKK